MTLWEYFDSRARRFGIVDTKLALGAAMFLALIIAKLVPEILNVSVWWFVVLWIAFGIRPMLVFFGSDTHVRRSSHNT
jgi:uncharacterized membrane protein